MAVDDIAGFTVRNACSHQPCGSAGRAVDSVMGAILRRLPAARYSTIVWGGLIDWIPRVGEDFARPLAARHDTGVWNDPMTTGFRFLL